MNRYHNIARNGGKVGAVGGIYPSREARNQLPLRREASERGQRVERGELYMYKRGQIYKNILYMYKKSPDI